MELIYLNHNEKLNTNKKLVAGIGQFDGLHLGHMKLINTVIDIARKKAINSAIITFDPHPDYVLKKRQDIGYITPLQEKIKLFSSVGIDILIIIEFDKVISEMDPYAFYNHFLFPVNTIVVGSDFRYGHRGQGNVDTLLATGKDIEIVDVVMDKDHKISSNTIRDLLIKGDVIEIKRLLNRYYSIHGKVIEGSKIGRTLGLNTANIEIANEYQMLKKGVYAVKVIIDDDEYLGACNIGNNPSINFVDRPRLEVHIFDFKDTIYGQSIEVRFLERIRDEEVFLDKDELVKQIKEDIKYIKERYQK